MRYLLLTTVTLLLMIRTVLLEKDSCFCQLKGHLDDCSCSVENIDSFNNHKIFPRLSRLLETDYFRYYKVNLFRKCPFESGNSGQCGSKSCAVDECTDDEIPAGLKINNHSKDKYTNPTKKKEDAAQVDCNDKQNELGYLDYTLRLVYRLIRKVLGNRTDEDELGNLDYTLSDASKKAFKDWKKHDDAQENFCELEDEEAPGAAYYDLVLNPERFTGYAGPSAVNVWKLIYDQNCFKPDKIDYHYLNPQQDLCLEKRVFYRMISGFHTSINVDVTANWLIPAKGWGQAEWGPNLEEFRKRFDPDLTYGEGPNRLKNLYFTYLVELRALAKAAPYLEQELYYTGNDLLDVEVQETLKDILHIIKSFPEHFDESQLFKGNMKTLMGDFKVHFRNISRIMDCVGCDKCRLWGKLQITGMGTALKILFSGDSMSPDSTVRQAHKKADIPFQLTRGEIVALLNGFGRISKSIHEIDNFRRMITK